ncbi:13677_t:CDS:2 [Acaulospora morrowiae]|uniref:13677_t:CDS:1 n=1 Tax=Acaulospora morrowiae TaxID=94023 RepID=A0A9N9D214_9GLOM|nr:13677_t:CDS:2 [Acaulospora morrowiae]
MVGYELKKFNGYTTEDSEEHIEEFRLWLAGSGIDVGAGYANRINAHGVFRASLKGDAKDWYERTIHGKNWELRNLLNNTTQANLAGIQGRNADQIEAQALNYANGQNGNVIIPAYTVFDKDWSFANGRSTDNLSNTFNANTGNTVIVPGIRLGQMEVCHLGIEKLPDKLLLKLEEIERYTAEQLSGAYLHSNSDVVASKGHGKNNYSNNTDMTKEEIENLIKGIMASSLSQPVSQTISFKPQENQIILS